ncbi:MAG: hypothetical protein FD134_24 [Gallionellaceae bacterium]|nr:MAG: hypothetical protein FD134_24 [Gallionellaceae bacterium]
MDGPCHAARVGYGRAGQHRQQLQHGANHHHAHGAQSEQVGDAEQRGRPARFQRLGAGSQQSDGRQQQEQRGAEEKTERHRNRRRLFQRQAGEAHRQIRIS